MQTGARIVEDKLPKNMDEQQAVNIFNTPFQFGRIWTALALSFNAPFQLTALHNRLSLLQQDSQGEGIKMYIWKA
jgi:hypothetical protein